MHAVVQGQMGHLAAGGNVCLAAEKAILSVLLPAKEITREKL